MKNVTLSIPEELLARSREYAARHGTSLNEFIRDLLRQAVNSSEQDPVQKLIGHGQQMKIQTKGWKLDRTEIYDRKIFS